MSGKHLAWIALAGALAASCASPSLRYDQRKEACRVAVEEKFAAAAFRPNAMSTGSGAVAGAGEFALYGLGMGQGAIIGMPLGAIIGAGYGTACAIQASSRPTANADFERILHEADASVMRRAIERQLSRPRSECKPLAQDNSGAPDSVLVIESLEASMGCLHGQQDFWVTAKWTTVSAKAGVLNKTTSQRRYRSPRAVDDWFAHPAEARAEIEMVFEHLGDMIGRQFAGD